MCRAVFFLFHNRSQHQTVLKKKKKNEKRSQLKSKSKSVLIFMVTENLVCDLGFY